MPMTASSLWDSVRHYVGPYRAQLRFSLRVALAALLAFALAQVLTIPLHGLWAVLTAVVVTQMSIGASIRATAEYVVGTLGGVIYASAVAVAVPHSNTIGLLDALDQRWNGSRHGRSSCASLIGEAASDGVVSSDLLT